MPRRWIAKSVLIVTIAVAAAGFGCQSGRPGSRATDFVIAESKSVEASIFRQNCAICHGNEAHGREMNGRMIPSLRNGPAANKSADELYDQILNGKLPMPPFRGQLSEEDIRKMVVFIRRDLQGKTD